MRCLVLFSHDGHWRDFRYAELDSLLRLNGIDPSSAYDKDAINHATVYLTIELPSEDIARSICSRSVLIHAIYELYVQSDHLGDTVSTFYSMWQATLNPYLHGECTWSVHVRAFCRTLTSEQQESCRLNFKFLAMPGKVKVNDPDLSLWLLLDYSGHPESTFEDVMTIPAYFGRQISTCGVKYIGPTSLDHSLALILANLAGVMQGNLVLDPFVGTASILVACSYFGAFCTGMDIDARVLRGEMYAGKADTKLDTSKRDIFSNFKAYGLPIPELIRMDNHLIDRHLISYAGVEPTTQSAISAGSESGLEGFFEVIVTDPPYGIRAGGRKSGKSFPVTYSVPPEKREEHIPSTQQYPVEEVMLDLLHTAARLLKLGGSLVYLIPTTYDFQLSDLPVHPCLEIKQMCEQGLSCRHGRRAVVMNKTSTYTAEKQVAFREYARHVLSGQDQGFGQLITKLERALSVDAIGDDDVLKRFSRRSKKRKEKKFKKLKTMRESHSSSATTGNADEQLEEMIEGASGDEEEDGEQAVEAGGDSGVRDEIDRELQREGSAAGGRGGSTDGTLSSGGLVGGGAVTEGES